MTPSGHANPSAEVPCDPQASVDSCDPTYLEIPYEVLFGGNLMPDDAKTIYRVCEGNAGQSCTTDRTPSDKRDNVWKVTFSPKSRETTGALHVDEIEDGGGSNQVTKFWAYKIYDQGSGAGYGDCAQGHMRKVSGYQAPSQEGIDYAVVSLSSPQAISNPPYEECPALTAAGHWGGGIFDP